MYASSRELSAALGLVLLASCAAQDIVERTLRDGPNDLPSGFGCEVAGVPVITAPLTTGDANLIFDVVRFDGDPPETNRLFDIRASCEDERRPCRVHQRICVPLDGRPRGERVRDYVTRRLIEATTQLQIGELEVAMFRLVITTQTDACERDEAGYRPLASDGGEVVGCAYTEVVPLHGIGVSRHAFAFDQLGDVCGPDDLVTCATVLGL